MVKKSAIACSTNHSSAFVPVTGTELNMFNLAPATGAGKNLVPEKYDTLESLWRLLPAPETGAGNRRLFPASVSWP